jgi:hypothetical protein
VDEINISEFPFVSALPRRDRSAVRSLWEQFTDFLSLSRTHGGLVPQASVARLLGLSNERVRQFVAEGRLEKMEFDQRVWITGESLRKFASVERINGRPPLHDIVGALKEGAK